MGKLKVKGIIVPFFLLFVLGSCSLFQGEDSIGDMNEAIEMVIQDILPAEVPTGTTYLCIRLTGSIPAGSIIRECSLEDNPVTLITDEESFFFLLDLAPRSYYAHPVKYILMGISGGVQVLNAEWWPAINNQTPEQFLVSIPDSVYVVDTNADLTLPQGGLMEFDFDSIDTQNSEGFIVVKGLMPGENLYEESTDTYLNGLNFFSRYKNAYSGLAGLVDGQAITLFDVVDQMADLGMNPITIYIIAHGHENWMSLSGHRAEAADFQSRMAARPDIEFNLLLGCCHSGSFIDDLEILANVRLIGTVCAWDELGTADIDTEGPMLDFNPEDSGSEWTSSVLTAAALILDTPSRWTVIQSRALHYHIPLTSAMLYGAFRGALGLDNELRLIINLDLANRAGFTTPQIYRSW